MGLNIKNTQVEAKIRRLAKRTGDGLTDALEKAVDEKLARMDASEGRSSQRPLLDRLRPLQEAVAAERRKTGDTRTARELMDELYDENGLPI
jgi:antitoxin VapB